MTIKPLAATTVLCALLCGPPLPVRAQESKPRRWSHLPTGINLAGMGFLW